MKDHFIQLFIGLVFIGGIAYLVNSYLESVVADKPEGEGKTPNEMQFDSLVNVLKVNESYIYKLYGKIEAKQQDSIKTYITDILTLSYNDILWKYKIKDEKLFLQMLAKSTTILSSFNELDGVIETTRNFEQKTKEYYEQIEAAKAELEDDTNGRTTQKHVQQSPDR